MCSGTRSAGTSARGSSKIGSSLGSVSATPPMIGPRDFRPVAREWESMSASIDFEAEGLLDGLDGRGAREPAGPARAAGRRRCRASTSSATRSTAVDCRCCRSSGCSPGRPRYTSEEIAELSGVADRRAGAPVALDRAGRAQPRRGRDEPRGPRCRQPHAGDPRRRPRPRAARRARPDDRGRDVAVRRCLPAGRRRHVRRRDGVPRTRSPTGSPRERAA